jgi:hypothetical protein
LAATSSQVSKATAANQLQLSATAHAAFVESAAECEFSTALLWLLQQSSSACLYGSVVQHVQSLLCVLVVVSGTLSAEWAANGTALQVLLLGNNRLTGSIPAGWGSLVINAFQVDLSNNKLWGSLGLSWYNVTKDPSISWSLNTTRLKCVALYTISLVAPWQS